MDNGVMIENVGSVACLVFVSSPEGQQQFELAVGQNPTVNGITQPIEVSAVSKWKARQARGVSATITIIMYAVSDDQAGAPS